MKTLEIPDDMVEVVKEAFRRQAMSYLIAVEGDNEFNPSDKLKEVWRNNARNLDTLRFQL